MEHILENLVLIFVAIIGSEGLLMALLKRRWDKQDKKDEHAERLDALEKKTEELCKGIAELKLFNEEQAEQQELIMDTLRLSSFKMLFEKLTFYIEIKGYATATDRESIQPYLDNYHAHHWNGDIEPTLKKFQALPSLPPDDREVI